LVRLIALVESEDHVCCRYRVAAFRHSLAAAGHDLRIESIPTSIFGRLGIGRDLRDADAVILQRKLLPRWAVTLLRQRVKRLIFDFDDAVWLRDSYAPHGFMDSKRQRRFQSTIAACDLVIAGNPYLAAEAAKYTAPHRVIVIPTCVDPTRYPVSTSTAGQNVQLVWIGSQSTLRGLERFTETLSAIGRAVPGIRLKLICDRFLTIPNLPIVECPWQEDRESTEIAAADIGISWVPDDPWSRGKCGLKILQYQAAGLPVIANPVGVHAQFVRSDATGYAATTTDEWIAAVARLSSDPALRRRLGRAGRSQVEEAYSVAAGTRLWLAALDHMATPMRKSG
jgi:glycosyltransferase involved in cell wall biosynthesis